MPSCPSCDESISKAERKIARASLFALERLRKGPRPKRRKDPTSGVLDAVYSLAPHPQGGWNEVAFRSGQDIPIVLPSIEVNWDRLEARTRFGAQAEELDELLDAIDRFFQQAPNATGVIGEIPAPLMDVEDEIGKHPDFWPRVFLDLSGDLKLRGRTPQEVFRTLEIVRRLLPAIRQQHATRRNGPAGLVPAGAVHHVMIEHDTETASRVVAKIAYGVAYLSLGAARMAAAEFQGLRRFVRGFARGEGDFVSELAEGELIFPDLDDHHAALVEVHEGLLRGVVELSGYGYMVQLGKASPGDELPLPTLGVSRRDGKKTYFLRDEAVEVMRQRLSLARGPALP